MIQTMTKAEALAALGCDRQIDLARVLGLSKQAISDWPDVLLPIQRDRVQAELYRRLMDQGRDALAQAQAHTEATPDAA